MDELAALMDQADPMPDLGPALLESSALMARSVATEPVAARQAPRRHLKQWIVAAVAALVLVPSTAVATGMFAARTGEHRPATTENDTSEVINVCAADFPAYVKSLPQPKDAPPAGKTWSQIASTVARNRVTSECAHGEKESHTFETGIKGDFYLLAGDIHICRAMAQHDAGREAVARQEARAYATTLERLDQLGIWGDTQWKKDHAAALAGDWEALRYLTRPVSGDGEPCK